MDLLNFLVNMHSKVLTRQCVCKESRWNIALFPKMFDILQNLNTWLPKPNTYLLSRSLMFSHLLVSKLCCGNINARAADLLPNCAKHWLFTSKCLLSVSRPIFFHSLICNLFLSAQNIVFSQVSATFVLPVPFFLFPNSQLIPNCKKHCVFTGKCCICLSSHFFLFPNSGLIRLTWKHHVFCSLE